MTWILANLQKIFIFSIGLFFLVFSLCFFYMSDVAGGTATFVMFFLCLIYSNVSQFKRFKGLGFEAELWEDKQAEAAHLIDRLKGIVEVYTREIVMASVEAGRWGSRTTWRDRWKLYDELTSTHNALGQQIDFRLLKERVFKYMIFDGVSQAYAALRPRLQNARREALELIAEQFPQPVVDVAGYSMRNTQLNEIVLEVKNLLDATINGNSADSILNLLTNAKKAFADKFEIEVIYDVAEIENLQKLSVALNDPSLVVHDSLIELAEPRPRVA
jgi:hypothetical protein